METKNNSVLNPGVTFVSADYRERNPGRTGTLLVVTGPSGVGKGTVVGKTLEHVDQLAKSVSVTTRKRREGEGEGVHYFYRTEEEFFEMKNRGEFLEYAEFAGHYYGTPARWVADKLDSGIDVILEIEVQGAMQIREKREDAVLIFLSPPSFEALAERLRTRATETEEKIRERLKKAESEIKQRHLFDYEVINDNLPDAIRNLESIVYAERLRI
jgi:guanylate kinase